ncbi:MAG: ComF family protein [Bacteroidales bacterium]|nr:ComF family protein [Bacteroidales bacterium]
MKKWTEHLMNLLYPRLCVACGDVLEMNERHVCTRCLYHLPKTDFHLQRGNEVEQMLSAWFPVERASAFFFFQKGSPFQKLLHELKYKGQKDIGIVFGSYIGSDFVLSGTFADVDMIVPVPLHPKKLKKRGYNQSECIAKGIAEKLSKPMETKHLVRTVANPSQTTTFNAEERRRNVENIFAVVETSVFEGKHVLLVDDVLTTGATVASCAAEILKSAGARVSVVVLARA